MHSAFDMTYDWNMHKTMNDVAKGKKNVSDIVQHIEKIEQTIRILLSECNSQIIMMKIPGMVLCSRDR